MDIPRIVRLAIGLITLLVTGALLYMLWRVYAYFYLKWDDKPEEKDEPIKIAPPPAKPQKRYNRPKFMYNPETHEFFLDQGGGAPSH